MPDREERPGVVAEALADQPGGKSQSSIEGSAHNGTTDAAGREDVSPQTRKGGIIRVTSSREVDCACCDCDLVVKNTGAAASHARSTRHTIVCTYATTFAFSSTETIMRRAAS